MPQIDVQGASRTAGGIDDVWHFNGDDWHALCGHGSAVYNFYKGANASITNMKVDCEIDIYLADNDLTNFDTEWFYNTRVGVIRGGTRHSDNYNGNNDYLVGGEVKASVAMSREHYPAIVPTRLYINDCWVNNYNIDLNTGKGEVIYICARCGEGGNGCSQGYDGLPNADSTSWVVLGQIQYNRPSEYRITLPSDNIYEKDTTYTSGTSKKSPQYSIATYSGSGATYGIDWRNLVTTTYYKPNTTTQVTWDYKKQYYQWDTALEKNNVSPYITPNGNRVIGTGPHTTSSTGYTTFKPSDFGLTYDGHYKVGVLFSDTFAQWISGSDKDFYIYRHPSISSLQFKNSSGTAITKYSPQITTNKLTWSQNYHDGNVIPDSLEKAFTTDLYGYSSSDKIPIGSGSTTTRTISFSDTQKLFGTYANNKWNGDTITQTFTAKRNNISSGKSVTTSKSGIVLQLKPTLKVTNYDVKYNGSSIKDTTQEYHPGSNTTIEFKYNASAIESGLMNGFYVNIVYYTNGTKQTYKVLDFSSIDSNGFINLNTNITNNGATARVTGNGGQYNATVTIPFTETYYKRSAANKVEIIPYYKDKGGTKRLGPYQEQSLFAIFSPLNTPVIDYPRSGGEWLNDKFRILLQLPVDPDYTSAQADSYRYSDIELYLKNTKVLSFAENPTAFSTSTLTYRKKIVINPSLVVANIDNYLSNGNWQIKIRVAKTVDGNKVWSNFSSVLTLYKTSLPAVNSEEFNIIKGQKITAGTSTISQNFIPGFNWMQTCAHTYFNAYPIESVDAYDKPVTIGAYIDSKNYQGLYNTVIGIQRGINSTYGALFDNDRNAVKINNGTVIDLLSGSNKTIPGSYSNHTGDVITARADERYRKTVTYTYNNTLFQYFQAQVRLTIYRSPQNSEKVGISGSVYIRVKKTIPSSTRVEFYFKTDQANEFGKISGQVQSGATVGTSVINYTYNLNTTDGLPYTSGYIGCTYKVGNSSISYSIATLKQLPYINGEVHYGTADGRGYLTIIHDSLELLQ